MIIKKLLERNAYLIAITLTILITISSLISLSGIGIHGIKIKNSDKIVHLLSYFILTLSWFYATQHNFKKTLHKTILIFLLILFGIIIEALQDGLTTYRQADFYDVLANSTGIFLAVAIFKKLNHWFNSI